MWNRPVHARDAYEASERDRPHSVLDALPLDLDDRRREAEVEAPRAQADRERGEEVTGLVHEDEEAQPHDRDEEIHAATNLPSVIPRTCASTTFSSSKS